MPCAAPETGEAALLEAAGTHLYPGARGRAPKETVTLPRPCIVLFADGARATGRLEPGPGGTVSLSLGPHVTARATRIGPKRWRIALDPVAGTFRVRARLGPA